MSGHSVSYYGKLAHWVSLFCLICFAFEFNLICLWLWEDGIKYCLKLDKIHSRNTLVRLKHLVFPELFKLLTVFCLFLSRFDATGGFPYPTVGNHELLAYLSSGQRLQRPENCSEPLYELMKHCWMENPEDRPYFSDIVTKLEPAHQRIYVDFNDLGPNYVFPPTTEDMLAKLKENDKNSHRL